MEIQKVEGIFDLTKNQFYIKNHKKTYIILTFNKILKVNDLSKEE